MKNAIMNCHLVLLQIVVCSVTQIINISHTLFLWSFILLNWPAVFSHWSQLKQLMQLSFIFLVKSDCPVEYHGNHTCCKHISHLNIYSFYVASNYSTDILYIHTGNITTNAIMNCHLVLLQIVICSILVITHITSISHTFMFSVLMILKITQLTCCIFTLVITKAENAIVFFSCVCSDCLLSSMVITHVADVSHILMFILFMLH